MKLPPERCFHFPDGSSASSLDELRDKIETISYDTFYHHVDSSKNDFASWIRYVLKDARLADELEKVNSIVETVEILNDYLHPKPAKEHLNQQDDIQSKIEKQIGFDLNDLPEPAPPTEPVPEIPQITEQELLEITESSEPQELPVTPEKPRPDKPQKPAPPEPAAQSRPAPEPRAQKSFHLRRSASEREEIDSFHDDMHRLIVKDFIWGMLFGLVLGFILARMLGI